MLHSFGKHAVGLAVYEFVMLHTTFVVDCSEILKNEKNDKTVENSTR